MGLGYLTQNISLFHPKKIFVLYTEKTGVTIDKIVEVVASVCMMIPKTYLYIIEQNGLYLAGGTSKLSGLANYLKDRLFLDIKILDEPEFAVAEGGSKFFYDKGKLSRMLSIDNLN